MNNKIYFETSEDPISEKDIIKFERKFKVKLPEDYKGFLLQHNGGNPNSSLFVNKKRKRLSPLRIKKETECSFGVMYSLDEVKLGKNVSIEIEDLPKNIFTIGYTPGNDYICISLSGEDKYCIYYAYNGEPNDNYENMYHLADSFTEFLNCLIPFDN